MTDDLATDDLAADLREALAGDQPAEVEQSAGRHPDDDSWMVKVKDDTPDEPPANDAEPAETDGDDLRSDLKDALDEAGPAEAPADDSSAWLREQRKLADQVLEGLGVDPAQRHARGLSRREVFRRLAAAEQGLRTDPVASLPALAKDYGSRLDEGGRMRLAAGFLSAMGLEHAGAISAAERQRLTAYEESETARAQQLEAARPAVEAQVQEFARTAPEFARLRPVMASLVSSGAANDLQSAYDMAARAAGLPDSRARREATAQATDEARRDKVAKSRAAGTPQTRNSPGRAPEPHKEQSLRDDLKDAFREQAGEY